jgi:HEAT repeat protein
VFLTRTLPLKNEKLDDLKRLCRLAVQIENRVGFGSSPMESEAFDLYRKIDLMKSVPILREALVDSDSSVRQGAAHAVFIGTISPGPEADLLVQEMMSQLEKTVKDSNQRVRYWTAALLVRGKGDGARLLVSALKDQDAGVREMAAISLGAMKDQESISADSLDQAAINDQNPRVRDAARMALQRIKQ